MLNTRSIARNSKPKDRCCVLTGFQRWVRLSLVGKKKWGAIFPYGRIPIQCISAQKIMFEAFADPESVMAVDCKQLSQMQRETMLEQLNLNGKTLFGAGLGDISKFDLPIPRSHIDSCGIKEWHYLC
jgi:hypothetical protein